MSYARPRLDRFTLDWLTVALVGLLAAFQVAVLGTLEFLLAGQPVTTQETDLEIGIGFLAIATVEITILLVGWRAYRHLSETWQKRLKYGLLSLVLVSLYVFGLYVYWLVDLAWLYVILVPLGWYAVRLFSSSGFKWIAFNAVAFLLGTLVVVMGGLGLAPPVVILVMAAFTLWDHIAVTLSDIMDSLVELSSSIGVPNFFVIPNTLRFDMSALQDYLAGDVETKPDALAAVIGLGDFIFPTLLLASVYAKTGGLTPASGGVIVGTSLAMILLRDAIEYSDNGLPALLWLNTGSIVGYAAGLGVTALLERADGLASFINGSAGNLRYAPAMGVNDPAGFLGVVMSGVILSVVSVYLISLPRVPDDDTPTEEEQ